MKIIISIGTLGLGGAEKQAIWLANKLSINNEVTLLTYSGGPRKTDISPQVNFIEKGIVANWLDKFVPENIIGKKSSKNSFLIIAVTSFKELVKKYLPGVFRIGRALFVIYKTLRLVFIVKKNIETLDTQLVITFLYHDTLVTGFAALLSKNKPKLIVNRRSPEGYGDKSRSIVERLLLRIIYVKAKVCVSNSNSNLESAVKDGIKESKIIIIPNYIEILENKTYVSLEKSKIILVNIANLIWYKNQSNLLRAIASDESLRSKIHLKIIGTGPLQEELISYSRENDLDVSFLGQVQDINKILLQSDAFINTSFFEGASNALLEGISVGLPCVTTSVGNVLELSIDGASLVVCDDFSPDSIRTAILFLLDDFENISKLALEFVPKFRKIYSEEKVYDLWSTVLERL